MEEASRTRQKRYWEFLLSIFFNRKRKLPYVTGKIAISKNNLIYSKINKKITNSHSDKFTHLLRYKNDAILISSKTLNIDNPKLDGRIQGLTNYSPKRVILDKNLSIKQSSYIFQTSNKKNTYIIYNNGTKEKINQLKKKGVKLR